MTGAGTTGRGGPRQSAPEPDGRRVRWAAHRAERRAAFVAAGVLAIDEHGPTASAEQVSDAADVSRTVLYRYFRDRDDLRQAIAHQIVQSVLDTVLPSLRIGPAMTPRDIIVPAVGGIIAWLDQHPNLYRFLRSRTGVSSLDSVETTLADRVAALLKPLLMFFGLEDSQAEPGAYGIVGFVETSSGWWLEQRHMSRERFTELVCTAVWHMLEGTARDNGVSLAYDEPLPLPEGFGETAPETAVADAGAAAVGAVAAGPA